MSYYTIIQHNVIHYNIIQVGYQIHQALRLVHDGAAAEGRGRVLHGAPEVWDFHLRLSVHGRHPGAGARDAAAAVEQRPDAILQPPLPAGRGRSRHVLPARPHGRGRQPRPAHRGRGQTIRRLRPQAGVERHEQRPEDRKLQQSAVQHLATCPHVHCGLRADWNAYRCARFWLADDETVRGVRCAARDAALQLDPRARERRIDRLLRRQQIRVGAVRGHLHCDARDALREGLPHADLPDAPAVVRARHVRRRPYYIIISWYNILTYIYIYTHVCMYLSLSIYIYICLITYTCIITLHAPHPGVSSSRPGTPSGRSRRARTSAARPSGILILIIIISIIIIVIITVIIVIIISSSIIVCICL